VSPQRVADEMERQAETHLRRVAASLPQDLSVTRSFATPTRREEILRMVREQPVDLISRRPRRRARQRCLARLRLDGGVHHSSVQVVVLHPARETGIRA
jgi:hypothetical protein